MRRYALAAVMWLCFALPAVAKPPEDPLKSPFWPYMNDLFLADAEVVFDPKVKVLAPTSAEDSLAVPVQVDASAIEGIQEVVVFADLNPIPLVMRYFPEDIDTRFAFRMKVQQATPIRAAVKAADGRWHLGQTYVDAAGGGCTVPSAGSATEDWSITLGRLTGRVFQQEAQSRLRFQVKHPMDTGLASGVPMFIIEEIQLKDPGGVLLARIEPSEPISEDPVFSVDLPKVEQVLVSGRDNNGNEFRGHLTGGPL